MNNILCAVFAGPEGIDTRLFRAEEEDKAEAYILECAKAMGHEAGSLDELHDIREGLDISEGDFSYGINPINTPVGMLDFSKRKMFTRGEYLARYDGTTCPSCDDTFTVTDNKQLSCSCGESFCPVCPDCGRELYSDEDNPDRLYCSHCGEMSNPPVIEDGTETSAKPISDYVYVLIDFKIDDDSVEVFSTPESVETAFRRTIINNWHDRFGTTCPVNTPEQITDEMIDEYTSREESGESIKKTNWYKRAIH